MTTHLSPNSQPRDPRMQRIAEKMAEGFRYLEDSTAPAYALRGDLQGRDLELREAHHRRYAELCEQFGRENVYVDIRLGEAPLSDGYEASEHTGFYVRDTEIHPTSVK